MPLDFLEDEKMIKALNTALYKAYLKKSGLAIGLPDEYYTITERLDSIAYTIHMIKAINAGRE